MKTDEILARYASRDDIQLTVRRLAADPDEGRDHVLIEGSQSSLRFLAELLLAVADDVDDDGRQLGPDSAGSSYFSDASEFGLYLYLSGSHKADRGPE